MNKQLQQLLDQWIEQYGLGNYEFSTCDFFKKKSHDGFIEYHLSVEFIPIGTSIVEEESSPSGTIIIDYNLTNELITSMSFLHQQSFSTITHFPTQAVHEVASWIENVTGFTYEEDFIAVDTIDNGYQFQGFLNGYAVHPQAMIEVQFNTDGKLTGFLMSNMEILRQSIKDETFHLTIDQLTPIIEQQLMFYHYPDEEMNRFKSIYTIDPLFLSNDEALPVSEDFINESLITIQQTLTWESPLPNTIERQPIDGIAYVTAEEAFHAAAELKKVKVSIESIEQIKKIATDVLRMIHPTESDEWQLEKIEADVQFLHLTCTKIAENDSLYNRKFIILVDKYDLQVLNYIDNQEILAIFEDFSPANGPFISHEQALQKILPLVSLTPTYLYNVNAGRYELCGMLHTNEYVDATTGEYFPLTSL